MVYVTGDCHGSWYRLTQFGRYEGSDLTRDDFVICCGDFGIWDGSHSERYGLSSLEHCPFTILFVDGNHENFDRLYSDEFKVVDFHGGKAHKICENVYHLMRGHIFDLCGNSFFTFGGASSHDIKDGILNPEDYEDMAALYRDYYKKTERGEMLRINHYSWWEQELPSDEEMEFGLRNLSEHGNEVDFIISHCAPTSAVSVWFYGDSHPDKLTDYFEKIRQTVKHKKWFFGHYHEDANFDVNCKCLYYDMLRVV